MAALLALMEQLPVDADGEYVCPVREQVYAWVEYPEGTVAIPGRVMWGGEAWYVNTERGKFSMDHCHLHAGGHPCSS